MSKLHACHKCSRHLRVDESSCPFCGETIAASARGPVRSAIFAGVLAGAAVTGCGDAKPVEDTTQKVEPGPAESDAMAAAPIEGDREFAKDPDEGDGEDEVIHPDPVDKPVPPMPYGAPPARRRLV